MADSDGTGGCDSSHHASEAERVSFEGINALGQTEELGGGISPLYNPWTQFTGMPTHNISESAGTFAWDVFTPSSTSNSSYGASIGDLDINSHRNFLSNCQNLLSGIGTNPPAEAPLQEGFSPPETLSSSFQENAKEGKEKYAEAVANWKSLYDPFGTPEPLSKDHNTGSVIENTEKQQNPGASNSKPTYSDIAKALKSMPIKNQPSKDTEESDTVKKKVNDPVSKVYKPHVLTRRPHLQRQHSKSLPGHGDDMESKVSPDSKYGLDQFEDLNSGDGGVEKHKSVSMESIPLLTRKGSTSSMSSGTSGIEDISLTSGRTGCNIKHEESVGKPRSQSDASSEKVVNNNKSSASKAFFDARRIFQTKEKRVAESSSGASNTMLNNGKPASGTKSSSSAHKKTTEFINNDLRDSTRKKTNQNAQPKDSECKKHENIVQNGKADKKSKHSSGHYTSDSTGPATRNGRGGRRPMFLESTFDQEYIDEWINYVYDKVRYLLSILWSTLVTTLLLLFGLIIYLVNVIVHVIGIAWSKISYLVKTYILKRYFKDASSWPTGSGTRKIGLEESITLPSTGDEAMQRLLACKGKDPYSILGLRSDACDDDIRKYYRKQAVLVHPDKNKQPGAEEAFKILGHAFELIGEPEKRKSYDFEATEVEVVLKDLLTKLQEAANMMRCDNCGGKHKRTLVDRPWYSARFCKRCNIRHSAKEGDVWAETSYLGFLWHYYACMEGQIFDITEWVACKKDFFKHMQASAHHVFYRIATEGSRGNSNQQRTGEADLEDFINHLFHQAMHTDGNGNQWQQPQTPQPPPSQNGPNWNTSAPTGKKGRRRKKKH
ncbi:uncharacterized protein LOC132561664 [Ylistrum balloti]|uniref:uncharacterized protein LOC132561664 n=1 Tax=Ylistrum balloti TaxID=509963 RepID=UPI0029059355|nr:uncharacterized protein LOC132561664 [Ylistrum balloti]